MYQFFYNNGVSDVQFYPLIEDFKIVRKRLEENPFIIREFADANLSITDTDFDYFEPFKGSSQEITGYFTETIGGNTKTYQCFFTVSEEINYSTKFLTITLFIRDKYYNLLDNPEKNIETEFDYTIEPQFITTVTQNYGGGVDLKKIIDNFLSQIDSSITVNAATYTFLTSNNYNYVFISNLENYNKTTVESLVELSEISLKYVLDFFSENSGMQVYFYLDSSNNAILDHINNLVQGVYVIDLTNYNGINWSSQKQTISTFEPKLSLIKYVNNGLQAEFKNVNCIFPKNIKNETENVYNFLVDIERAEIEDIGKLISNTNKIETDKIISELVNNNLDIFTSNNFGKDNSGTNNTGGYQFSEQLISEQFTANKYQQIELSWTNNISPNGKVEIYNENLSTIVASFDISAGSGVFTFVTTDGYRIRLALYNSGESFDISNFTANLIEYVVRKINVVSELIENYEFSPEFIIDNFIANMPNTDGIINGVSETGLNKKPNEVEEIEFPYNNLLDNFPFDEYIKTSLSEEMIPYSIERTVLNADNKGFDRLILKKK